MLDILISLVSVTGWTITLMILLCLRSQHPIVAPTLHRYFAWKFAAWSVALILDSFMLLTLLWDMAPFWGLMSQEIYIGINSAAFRGLQALALLGLLRGLLARGPIVEIPSGSTIVATTPEVPPDAP